MPRIGVFTSQLILTAPPLEFSVYRVPINPTEIDPLDSDDAEWYGGLNTGGRYKQFFDNRERKMVWRNLPAYDGYVAMVHYLENWVGLDYVHLDLGNSIVPGLYATGADWKRVSLTRIEVGDIDGSNTVMSSGTAYDVYSSFTVYYEILGDVNG